MSITLNGTTGISGVDGSASTPALQGNDTNTGIFYPAADTIAFAEGGTEVMRIDSSGNVGIGTSSPQTKLTVAGEVRSLDGTVSTYITSAGGSGGYLGTRSNDFLSFQTNATDRMRIGSTGNVSINTTGAIGGSGGRVNIIQTDVNLDMVQVRNSGAAAGRYWSSPFVDTNSTYYIINNDSTGVRLTHGATSWATQSDERLKNVTGTYTNALLDISQIKPVKFTWKDDPTNKAQVGVIAQSVLPVVPEAVESITTPKSEDKTEYLSVRYTELIPLMIAAIQEQQTIIKTQSDAIADLKTRIEALEGAK
ncbi:Intramolecular chaperone auto-processing domain containing protein [uncultured Caudovirales phage]|uniref:Intramolecular chaperone auto-processing domain containing protein n=1 Tax=uncultured Caudovirales phage TaxID=2100421 RepID=A0A6J5M2D9_9CAUD|nr:Intramolecular chaperone auto-processing domain containing protein [uncultured Caudovirales phage]